VACVKAYVQLDVLQSKKPNSNMTSDKVSDFVATLCEKDGLLSFSASVT